MFSKRVMMEWILKKLSKWLFLGRFLDHHSDSGSVDFVLNLNVCKAVDFAKLEMISLKAYRRHFQLDTRPNAPKIELINAVSKHFASGPKFREADVLSEFLSKLQREQAMRESYKLSQQGKVYFQNAFNRSSVILLTKEFYLQ